LIGPGVIGRVTAKAQRCPAEFFALGSIVESTKQRLIV
jgi:hypothetical protein